MSAQPALFPDLLPALPGCIEGVVGRDPWRVQCQECGLISEGTHLLLTIRAHELVFHPWPDDTNPRLCRDCRLSRGCGCDRCDEERRDAARNRKDRP